MFENDRHIDNESMAFLVLSGRTPISNVLTRIRYAQWKAFFMNTSSSIVTHNLN